MWKESFNARDQGSCSLVPFVDYLCIMIQRIKKVFIRCAFESSESVLVPPTGLIKKKPTFTIKKIRPIPLSV